MIDDIHDHFSQRLRRLVGDTVDTCNRGGVKVDDALKIVISGLVFEAAFAAAARGFDEDDFVAINRRAMCMLLENPPPLEEYH